jgi:hypothetical protein
MPLKAWQCALAFILQALSSSWCIYFLVPAYTDLGGRRGAGWNHRTFHLIFTPVFNASMAALVWSVPKRQVFFMCLVSSFVTPLVSSDAIWNCTHLRAAIRVVATLELVILMTYMRKLAARVATGGANGATQFTRPQKVFLFGTALNFVGQLVAPDWRSSGVIEILLWIGALAEGWTHFVAFERASSRTFGQVTIQIMPAAARETSSIKRMSDRVTSSIKHVRGAKRNMGRNVRLIFLWCHIMTGCMVLYNPLWPANASSECQVSLA